MEEPRNTKDANERFVIYKKCGPWSIIDRSIALNPFIRKYHPSLKPLSSLITKGLMLDLESWYSVTPEQTTELVIKRIERAKMESLTTSKTVFCAYCGVGGDALIFLKSGYDVICSDVVYKKIKFLKHNYQVLRSEFKGTGNMMCMTKGFFETQKSDFVRQPFIAFVSPPWGGVDYKNGEYNLDQIGLEGIHKKMVTLVDNVIYFLPRNCNPESIKAVVGPCKIHKARLCNRDFALLVYSGPLFNSSP